MKKIVIVKGSPRKNGNSNNLVTAFATGAAAAGHQVEIFETFKKNINGCCGDQNCSRTGICGQKDDLVPLNELMRSYDVVVFASPVYFGNFTAWIKPVIDRCYQYTFEKGQEQLTVKEAYLIATAANPDPSIFDGMLKTYHILTDKTGIENKGTLLCPGLAGLDALDDHMDYITQAVKMGMEV